MPTNRYVVDYVRWDWSESVQGLFGDCIPRRAQQGKGGWTGSRGDKSVEWGAIMIGGQK